MWMKRRPTVRNRRASQPNWRRLGALLREALLCDYLVLGGGNDLMLLRRHQHVADRDRNAGAGSQAKTGLHQLVGENNRFLQATTAKTGIDESGDFLLLERLVDD